MEEENNSPAKKAGLTQYVVIAIVVLTIASFAVEAIAALKEGRAMNMEIVNKALDTLIALMQPPAST
ncbi:hypothetical protein D3C81_1482530 [compost metagenome]